MSTLISEIRTLCLCLEDEIEGRPFDHLLAKDIADRLAEKLPSIRNNMKLICQRVDDRLALDTAGAA